MIGGHLLVQLVEQTNNWPNPEAREGCERGQDLRRCAEERRIFDWLRDRPYSVRTIPVNPARKIVVSAHPDRITLQSTQRTQPVGVQSLVFTSSTIGRNVLAA